MTTVSRFPRQNDAGLRALFAFLWENLLLVLVLVLESKGTQYLTLIQCLVRQLPRFDCTTLELFLPCF